jgi:hypothetical protein
MTTETDDWHVAQYSDEDAYNDETDRYDLRKVKVACPGCKRVFAALCSPHTETTSSGWRWVGCDHREPFVSYRTKCRCGRKFRFDTYTPQ